MPPPDIRHLGPFPERELHKYYSQGSVFCLNSIEDGFGMILVQAMACGLPVITTTNTGGADIVRDGRDGFIIPIRDVAALKEKILYFYENPEAAAAWGRRPGSGCTPGSPGRITATRSSPSYRRILAGPGRGKDEKGSRGLKSCGAILEPAVPILGTRVEYLGCPAPLGAF